MEREDRNNNIVASSVFGHKGKGVAQWYIVFIDRQKRKHGSL